MHKATLRVDSTLIDFGLTWIVVLYDFVAPFYDPVLKPLYRPFRKCALEWLPLTKGASVLDLACGTGQNFSTLASKLGEDGKIIGVDISTGMLQRAKLCARRLGTHNVSLANMDASSLSAAALKSGAEISSVDFVICTWGFTAMRNWETAFQHSWNLLKPGGGYLILDIHAAQRSLHARAVELVCQIDMTRESWEPLRACCSDFEMEYIDPSAYLFGGRLFVAHGTKPKSESP